MAIIGAFHPRLDGSFSGVINTPLINLALVIRPAEKDRDSAPDFRVFAGRTDFGAAWKMTSTDGREYLAVTLDDPSLVAPIHGSLIQGDSGFLLIWSRAPVGD